MRVPDTREQFTKSLYHGTKGMPSVSTKNGYWQGYLNEHDACFIDGYDWCMKHVDEVFEGIATDNDLLSLLNIEIRNIDKDVVLSDQNFSDYSKEEQEKMTPETKTLIGVRELLNSWLEMVRNETIVSCLDNMDDEEYQKIEKQVDAGKYKNIIIQKLEEKKKEE